jgi:2-polyprenyl-3-methyl-5-hydroxy-6-metoxy-1,4-benzoquinol methylase
MRIEVNDEKIDVQAIISRMKEELGKHIITEELGNIPLKSDQPDLNKGTLLDIDSLYTKVDILNKSWHTNPEFIITSHRRIVGPLIVFGKKLVRKFLRWYITPYAVGQNEFNGNITRTINEVFTQLKNANNQMHIQNERLTALYSELKEKNNKIKELQSNLERLNGLKEQTKNILEGTHSEINAEIDKLSEQFQFNQQEYMEKLEYIKENVVNLENEIEQKINNIDSTELTSIKQSSRVANERLRRLERKLRALGPSELDFSVVSNSSVVASTTSGDLDFDYFLFEEYYRGSREEIIQRQRQYLPYFSGSETVLDLGCGRGEFTELMNLENINVVSVDINDDMVDYCLDRGFNVKKMDLLEYLQSIDDSSVDGVFLGQVIEHMKPEDIINMVKLAYKKLKPNSWLIAETPNPRSLSIFAQSFYLDLTHNKPIHPFTAKFIWESEGFRDVEVQYFSPNNPAVQLPSLSIPTMDQETLNQFNTGLKHWNEVIFGNQDYFVAGKK